MIDDRGWGLVAWLAVAAFTFGGCGLFRPSVTLTPAAITHAGSHEDPSTPVLRVDFYSRPELFAEDSNVYIGGHARFCDADDNDQLEVSPAKNDGESIVLRRPVDTDETKPMLYSVDIDTGHSWRGSSYDLLKEPRPLCVWLDLWVAYDFFQRTTNVMRFSAEQVGAAARAKP
jgi:hypothetical protein